VPLLVAEKQLPDGFTAYEAETATELEQTALLESLPFNDLSLPEVVSLASAARLFLGNDSGIAHIAAAVGVPTVVIFGSSTALIGNVGQSSCGSRL